MTRHAPISRIYRLGEPTATPDPERAWARQHYLRRELWARLGVVAVEPRELPDELAAPLVAWAVETYGKGKR